jgi:hypothetical protein
MPAAGAGTLGTVWAASPVSSTISAEVGVSMTDS